MKKVQIIALHLAYGGVEKAICNMANGLVSRYDVEIICMYDMPNAPAYFLSERVQVTYLMKQIPNKKEFLDNYHQKHFLRMIKEGIKSIWILKEKKAKIKSLAQSIHDGVVITTRNEDTVIINKYMDKHVYKIAQLHHDHKFDERLIKDFQENYQNIDVFALLCPKLCEEVQDIMKGHNAHTRCVVIPNFIGDLPAIQSQDIRQPIMLAVGRLHQVKGFDRLLKMVPKLFEGYPQWQLHIIGDGEEEASLRALSESLLLQNNVKFLGRKDSGEIERAMCEASLFLMTSYSEGFPFVLLEAMSCSLPVIAYDVRVGPGALVQNKMNGYLIEDEQENEFIEACHSLMVDDAQRIRMGAHAYDSSKHFTKAEVMKLWFDCIEKGLF